MGWNSWNLFQSKIDDKTVRGMADAMVSSGMRDAGYIYVNIDDTWEGVRDAQGDLQPNSKFPDMKALADYVHSKGLKFGIYSSPGHRTCAEYPGSYGHEVQDAKQYAAWGVDYLKYDWCGARMIYKNADDLQPVYQTMGDALVTSGRAIVYSLCEYGNEKVETWGAKGRRQPVAHHRRHLRQLAQHDRQHREAGAHRALCGPRPLERSGHARDRQRPHDRRGVSHAHEPVGARSRSVARGQRRAQP